MFFGQSLVILTVVVQATEELADMIRPASLHALLRMCRTSRHHTVHIPAVIFKFRACAQVTLLYSLWLCCTTSLLLSLSFVVETKTKLVLKFKMCFQFKFDKNLIKVWSYYLKEWFCDLVRILTSLLVPKFLNFIPIWNFIFVSP